MNSTKHTYLLQFERGYNTTIEKYFKENNIHLIEIINLDDDQYVVVETSDINIINRCPELKGIFKNEELQVLA
ncbi:MAG: hypothetical protein J7K26_00360 [Candidatus Aenigmarchaeota archaeon]|nr:hypothetical protein [Candidatus Aenigmarchaeota archaeon]